EPEDFPWHDPGLSLDERIALADGRRPERRLMAAMAQTDCGQCGYTCQAYAEAIASGIEQNLTLCAPGGRETSRQIKQLLTEGDAPALPATVAAAPAPSPRAPRQRFVATLRAAQKLTRGGAQKDTRLVTLDCEIARGSYAVGDSLGVVARNCPELVAAI